MAYMTVAELRAAVPDLADEAKFADATLSALVDEFAEIAERYLGVAFETRSVTVTRYLTRDVDAISLGHIEISAISSVTVDGTAVASTTYELNSHAGALVAGFYAGSTVVIAYTHGLTDIPETLLRACRIYVRACALADKSSIPRDVIGQAFEGTYTRYSTPDSDAGRPTGYLEVDRLLNSLDDFRPSFA